jgi:uncharacterized lipoprotein YmbA
MMRYVFIRLAGLALIVAALVPAGCVNLGEGTIDPTRLYVLSSLSGTAADTRTAGSDSGLAVAVGPIELPGHLDRPQIVTRASRNELRLAEFAQWAEPLGSNVSRVLMENLSILLATDQVVVFPKRVPIPIDYQVSVKMTRFDSEPGGSARLDARWAIFAEEGKKLLLKGKSSYAEPVGSDGYEAMVAAESRTLEVLSREIAAAIENLER